MSKINKEKLKLGIWLHNTSPNLVGEGISRLLAFIIKNAEKNDDIEVSIACVSWMKQPTIQFFKSMNIDTSNITFICEKNTPYVYRCRRIIEKLNKNKSIKEKKKKKKNKIIRIVKSKLNDLRWTLIKNLAGTNNTLFLVIKFLVLLIPLIMIIIFSIVFYLLNKVISNRITNKIKEKVINKTNKVKNKIPVITRLLYENMLDKEFERLTKMCIRSKKEDVWFMLYPNNKYIKDFKKPVVLAVPDLVYLDFPMPFLDAYGGGNLANIHKNIVQTIENASSTISYCQYIADTQVKPYFKHDQKFIKVIPHANINSREHLERLQSRTKIPYTELSERLIQKYIQRTTKDKQDPFSEYIRDFDWSNVEYIFISSQIRPHKNCLNIFKAFKILSKDKYRNIKLVITGNPYVIPEVAEYIHTNNLQNDILPLVSLPPRIHAAFYCRATLTVIPTLFEGGFPPFCLSESLSVDTPVVLSNIAAARDMSIEVNLREKMLFDPYDISEIVNKIEWALDNSNELLNMEMKFYEQLDQRTWDDVVSEYMDCFRETAMSYR